MARPPRRGAGRGGGGARAGGRRGDFGGRSGSVGSRDNRVRGGIGGEVVEGRQAVAALLDAARRPVRDVWVTQGQDPAPVLDRIVAAARSRQVPVVEVSRARMDAEARTEAPQGVLAHADPPAEHDLEGVLAGGRDAIPFVLAFDGVTDPHNIGALLRSAEACGVTAAVLPRRRSPNVTPTVAKAAAGAIEYLDLVTVPGLPAALARARELGAWVVGLDADADRTVYELEPALAGAPMVVVVGSEGRGLSELVRRRCDLLLRIPMAGATRSLNVSVAGAVALFEIARRRSAPSATS